MIKSLGRKVLFSVRSAQNNKGYLVLQLMAHTCPIIIFALKITYDKNCYKNKSQVFSVPEP